MNEYDADQAEKMEAEIKRLEKENAKLREVIEKLRVLAVGALDDLAPDES